MNFLKNNYQVFIILILLLIFIVLTMQLQVNKKIYRAMPSTYQVDDLKQELKYIRRGF